MKILFHLILIVGSYSLSTENKEENHDGSTKVLNEILNRESLVRLSMVQKMQTLMLGAVEAKQRDETLKENLENIEKELQAIKDGHEKYKEENQKVQENLRNDIRQLQEIQAGAIDDLKNIYWNLSLTNNETFKQDAQLQKIQSQLQSGLCKEIPGNYAFYAQLTTTTSDNDVIFEDVKTNEGSAYNGKTGIFTCKYSGSYAFSWTIATSNHRYTEAELLVNDEVIGSSGTDSRPSRDTADSSTGFVVCNLQIGDTVRVAINGTADGIYSTFSGWRIGENYSSFYAKATSTLNKPSSSLHGFPFQNVVVNNGYMYDSYNGTFTCPTAGLYAFVCTVESRDGNSFAVYFHHEGSKLSAIPIQPDAMAGEYVDTSSTLQIFSMSRGDKIYLYSTDGTSVIQPVHSTFSGWRISSASNISAFMAYTSTDTSSSPMTYNKELLDTTSSFMSSYFQAPEDGVYLFFWHMHAYNIRLESFLQVNDRTVGQTIGDATSAEYEGSSNLAILRLRKNDRVKITHDGRADEDQTMVSGYLLFT